MEVNDREEKKEVKKEVETKVKEEMKREKSLSLIKVLLINVLVSLLVAVGVVYVYDRYYAQKIVAFDLRGYMLGLRDMYVAGKINDEGLKQAVEAVYKVIKDQRKNRVVLMKDVILNSVEEIGYPMKVEFSSFSSLFNNGTLGGGISDGVK
jgi:hypothetical protein